LRPAERIDLIIRQGGKSFALACISFLNVELSLLRFLGVLLLISFAPQDLTQRFGREDDPPAVDTDYLRQPKSQSQSAGIGSS